MEFVAGLDEDNDGWPGAWATSSARDGRGWTTPSTPSAATPTWPTWPGPWATARPAAGQWARLVPCWRRSRRPGGTAVTPAPTPTPCSTPATKGLPAALDRADPDRCGAAEVAQPCRRTAGLAATRQRHAERARATLPGGELGFPHRHRTDLGPGGQPRPQLRFGGLRSAE